MSLTDPIADLLTRIRNAIMVRHDSVLVPASRLKIDILRVLKGEGFIANFEVLRGGSQRMIKVQLKYTQAKQPFIIGLKRVSRPGLRIYASKDEIPRLYGGIGVAILSTSRGVMTGHQARRLGIGGEYLCSVW